jgi:hypothetical protein
MTTKEQIKRLALQVERLALVIVRFKKAAIVASSRVDELGKQLEASTAKTLESQAETIAALKKGDELAAALVLSRAETEAALLNDKADKEALDAANTKTKEAETLAADLLVATQTASDRADALTTEVMTVRETLAATVKASDEEKAAAAATEEEASKELETLTATLEAITAE